MLNLFYLLRKIHMANTRYILFAKKFEEKHLNWELKSYQMVISKYKVSRTEMPQAKQLKQA